MERADGWTDEEALANARLMGTAPELLEACERMICNERVGDCQCANVKAVCGQDRVCDACFLREAVKKAGSPLHTKNAPKKF